VALLTRFVSLPLLVAIAGAVIVLYQWIGARPLWLDEEMIALNFRDRSFTALGGRLWLDQSAPLGWLVVERLVLLIFGSSELALRAVPALFGIATIAAALLIGQRWLTVAGSATFVLLCSTGQWITFHAVELKPYSGDTFWALCLPALAAAAAGASTPEERRRRVITWSAAAAAGHWFSLGALLVLPACFAVLAVSMRRSREGIRLLAMGFALVLASFVLHYLVTIRHTLHNPSLQEYWQFAFPPPGAGVTGSLQWLYAQLQPIAVKPGGSSLAVAFWASAAMGFAFAALRAPWMALASALVVLSGFALGVLRIAPLYERLSLWMVPTLYLGIAMFADRGVLWLRGKPPARSSMKVASACVILVMVVALCADIVDRGIFDVRAGRPRDSNHEADDRTALAWVMQQRQPGDLLITTRHALPAIWWYGGVPIAEGGGHQFSDGGGIFTAELHEDRRGCRGRGLDTAVTGRQRVQVYFGFPDSPPGFDDLLLQQLSKFGAITAVRHFAGRSRAAVVDPAVTGVSDLFWEDAGKDTGSLPKGCIAVRRGRIW
jgi:hypothetical protein